MHVVRAIDAFVSATRTRSGDSIAVLVHNAEDIKKLLITQKKERLESLDQNLLFFEGLYNNRRDLQVSWSSVSFFC